MFEKSKTGTLFSTIGILSGLIYASKRNKKTSETLLYALGFGAAGYFLGNAINKFYE